MRLKFIIASVVVATMLVSCSSADKAISDLRSFNTEIKENSSDYGISEWKDAFNRYEKIEKRLAKNAPKYDSEQQREIGKLRGECWGNMLRGVAGGAVNVIQTGGSMLRGLYDGLKETLGPAIESLMNR